MVFRSKDMEQNNRVVTTNAVGIITAPINPALMVIRPVQGSSTVGRQHTLR